MRPAVANSKRTSRPIRRERAVAYAPAGFGHHALDGVAPLQVVSRLLVACGSIRVAIALEKQETIGLLGILKDVESSDPFLSKAILRVLQRGRLECLDRLRLHPHMNENDEHDDAST